MSFLSNNCTFTVLTEEVLADCKEFDCGHADLNDFFQNDCINYSEQLLGKSYCFTLDEDPSTIVCAFTVSNDSIKTYNLQKKQKKQVIKKIPHDKRFDNYPAVLIGRLGVSEEFKCNGIGQELMDFIKSWFINSNNKTGCRFIVVDSYNEEKPLNYYKKNGFKFIYENIDEEKSYAQLTNGDELRTRLMYYDLIVLSSSKS